MSWPWEVVPSQCTALGPRLRGKPMNAGLYGAIWPGKTARTMKNSSKIAPAVPLRSRKRARVNFLLALWLSLRFFMGFIGFMGGGLTRLSGPGIDDRRDHVGGEHAEQDGEGDKQ